MCTQNQNGAHFLHTIHVDIYTVIFFEKHVALAGRKSVVILFFLYWSHHCISLWLFDVVTTLKHIRFMHNTRHGNFNTYSLCIEQNTTYSPFKETSLYPPDYCSVQRVCSFLCIHSALHVCLLRPQTKNETYT